MASKVLLHHYPKEKINIFQISRRAKHANIEKVANFEPWAALFCLGSNSAGQRSCISKDTAAVLLTCVRVIQLSSYSNWSITRIFILHIQRENWMLSQNGRYCMNPRKNDRRNTMDGWIDHQRCAVLTAHTTVMLPTQEYEGFIFIRNSQWDLRWCSCESRFFRAFYMIRSVCMVRRGWPRVWDASVLLKGCLVLRDRTGRTGRWILPLFWILKAW